MSRNRTERFLPDRTLPDRLLNAAEAAHYLGYSEGTVRNKASAGEIPFVKLGGGAGALRFRLSELDAWIVRHNPRDRAQEGAA